jgi:DNA-binding beta-propeller fold protein YncE
MQASFSIDASGNPLPGSTAVFNTSYASTTQSGFSYISGLAYDPGTHKLYVADGSNNRIMIFDGTTMSTTMQSISPFGP